MDNIEIQPMEAARAGEIAEGSEAQRLDDATFEPLAYVEQVSDYRQAEAVQTSLEVMVASLLAEQIPSGELPVVPEAVDASQATEGEYQEPGGEGAIPISIPGVQIVKEQDGSLSQSADEIGFKYYPKETAGTVEVPLPGTAGEIGIKIGEVKEPGSVEVPLPRTAGEDAGLEAETGPIPMRQPEQAAPLDEEAAERFSHQEGSFQAVGEGGSRGEDITPISLPNVQDLGENEFDEKGIVKGTEGISETPLPGTAVETGWKLDEGEFQIPLASPAQEGIRDELLTIDQMVTRAETAMDEMSQAFNQQYLDLQKQMQDENRQFTMVSNIMKTKHDTAENSINNIR